MHLRGLVALVVAGVALASCAANDMKARKDDSWSRVSQTLPDGEGFYNPSLPKLSNLPDPTWTGFESVPNAYGHLFRPVSLLLYPVGVVFDYVVIRPLYMLGGLAPEWFGVTADDAQGYHDHMPELVISKDAPRYRFE